MTNNIDDETSTRRLLRNGIFLIHTLKLLGRRAMLLALVLIGFLGPALADLTPLNGAAVAPNIAEIVVSNEGVSVALEIYVEDIRQFEDILPDSWIPPNSPERLPEEERLKRFSEFGLGIRSENGAFLPVSVRNVAPRLRVDRAPPNAGQIDPITGRMIPKPPEDPRVVYAELFYDFQGQKPNSLEIVPPINENGNLSLSIGMIVFDRDVPVTDFRSLSSVARLTIDWNDPWYSKFDNPNLRRHHQNTVMSFLYADPYEVRFETLMRVRDAAALIGVEIKGDFLEADDRAVIDRLLPALIKSRSPMTIDDNSVEPNLVRISYHKVSPSGLTFLDEGETVRTDAAIVGLIYSVPTSQFAKEATVEWTLFSDAIQKIPAQTIDAAGPFLSELTPVEPVLIWTNYFKNYSPPVASPVLFGSERSIDVPLTTALLLLLLMTTAIFLLRRKSVSRTKRTVILLALLIITGTSTQYGWVEVQNPMAGTPNDARVTGISSQLIENFHIALLEKTPEQLEDALRKSITDEAFAEVNPELERALLIEMQGGGVGSVQEIRDFVAKNIRPINGRGGFQASISWSVTANGDHWGHPHAKNIRFSALMDVEPFTDAWKVTGITVTSAQPEP